MTTTYRKKLIEVALPLAAINSEGAQRKRKAPKGFPTQIHTWWAQRPLAAARAVLFAQLVDDPSAWPELFPTTEAQDRERQRLFRIIERLILWQNGNDEESVNAARLEIARSHARSSPSPRAIHILGTTAPKPRVVDEYLATELPPVHDPFAGAGMIPLEAQRLGMRAIAADLNPVAVLINKALLEIPARFAGRPPVNAETSQNLGMRTWRGADGLANDVRYYGAWILKEGRKRSGHLYPDVQLPKDLGGGKAPVVAWLWARTVPSPNPAMGGTHVPLISSYWLSTTDARKTWLEPVVGADKRTYRFDVRTGAPSRDAGIESGTKLARGANFRCLLSGVPIDGDYIKTQANAGRMGARLIAVVAAAKRGRTYLAASPEQETIALAARTSWAPEFEFAKNSRHLTPWIYGITTFASLFTQRQLAILAVLTDLVTEAQSRVAVDAKKRWPEAEEAMIAEYALGVSVYLSFIVSRVADYGSSLATWRPKDNAMRSSLPRQAMAMTWDFAEGNPFGDSSAGIDAAIEVVASCLTSPGIVHLPCVPGNVYARNATGESLPEAPVVVSTDPPYYDNVPYADLSDFFYVWLRRSLQSGFPEVMRTILVPKTVELVADPFRQGGTDSAERFFREGMSKALLAIEKSIKDDGVACIYYAFKQSEVDEGSAVSTGWQVFLEAVVNAGFVITGTWPLRTEGDNRQRAVGANALASSVVLACRKRSAAAPVSTRSSLRKAFREELPLALRELQRNNIAPVDVAQASIGPGMAVFSRYAKVVEADGSPMAVRSALQLINEALDEYLTANEGEVDPYTRFAITWYETNGWNTGSYGDAENLSKARNVSVAGVVEAGILHSAAGKVRLLKRAELPDGWDPANDSRLTVWEATQHLIKRLDKGESEAARLLKQLGPLADAARDLAYRLYNTCERRGWAEDARAYNGLVVAWPELEKLAQGMSAAPAQHEGMLIDIGAPTALASKGAPRRARKKS